MSDIENQETELHDSVENDEIVSEAQEPKGSGDSKLTPAQGKDSEKASVDSAKKLAMPLRKHLQEKAINQIPNRCIKLQTVLLRLKKSN